MMATAYPGAVTTPNLSDSQIKDIFLYLDSEFNRVMIHASLHGIYTGVMAVTLWASIASGKRTQNNRHLLVLILLLYLLATVGLYYDWTIVCSKFIQHNTTFWTAYDFNIDAPITLTGGIDAILSTFLADATLIWRCWIIWGRSWRVVFILIVCTTSAIISRAIVTFYEAVGPNNMSPGALYLENIVNWAVLYSSLVLATFLWCTILIVYRILRLGGVAARIRVYHRVIEMLVESAALYSAVVTVLLVFEVRNEVAGAYIEEFSIAIRGIAPTVLVGRVAAGHARPDDSWSGSSATASLRFGGLSSSQNNHELSVVSGQNSSSRVRPDLEEGSESSTRS
ncbi:hypothetical protein IW261DRAFT_1511586 [Armillaria novae-zelandiae]|uniref:Uncharacterized protein n=1 Tax=Armillaria novae-zelandiae TaxID=153914 RepID=A0AA39NTM0_9AGAR|nr:hypothetical protein IW261DRAFT_1511586 [Armillaria novae-zelandiae]